MDYTGHIALGQIDQYSILQFVIEDAFLVTPSRKW